MSYAEFCVVDLVLLNQFLVVRLGLLLLLLELLLGDDGGKYGGYVDDGVGGGGVGDGVNDADVIVVVK